MLSIDKLIAHKILNFYRLQISYFYLQIVVKREEARKAQILFAIVIFFVVCNVPRTVLNLEELVVIAPSYWRNYKYLITQQMEGMNELEVPNIPMCYSPPFWAHILGSISKFLLTLNASVCLFIYCVMGQIFRSKMYHQIHCVLSFLRKVFRCI